MELLYIWIEEYKNIKGQGFNFSSKHRFEFIPQKDNKGNIIGGKLKHEENSNYIENFFDRNINITAIIGKNGAGKSLLIEFIRGLFVNPIYEGKFNGIFCITKHTQTDTKYKIQGYEELLSSITLISKQEHLFEKYNHKQSKGSGFSLPFAKGQIIKNHKSPILFYSNIYDGTLEKYSVFENQKPSVSTNYLIKKEHLISQDILRQLIFIKDNPKITIDFDLPDELIITINRIDISVESKRDSEEVLSLYLNYINTYEIGVINRGFIRDLHNALLVTFINLFENIGDYWLDTLLKTLNKYSSNIETKNIDIRTILMSILNDYKQNYNIFTQEIDAILSIINFFESPDIFFLDIRGYTPQSCIYKITNKSRQKQLNKLLEAYQVIDSLKESFFVMEWRNLSSGEKAILNLYSRIYSAVKYKKSNELIILIDEGETGFHPQWQKKYLKILITFLYQIFQDKKIQIILTSHSPFLVSDLPKENIIFIRKGDKEDGDLKGKCIVVGETDKYHSNLPKTFGQNIHTLLAHSFFMDNGLMGDFAKDKINDLLDNINNLNIDDIEKGNLGWIEKMIQTIGDEFLQNQIQKFYDEKKSKLYQNSSKNILGKEKQRLKKQLEYIDQIEKQQENDKDKK